MLTLFDAQIEDDILSGWYVEPVAKKTSRPVVKRDRTAPLPGQGCLLLTGEFRNDSAKVRAKFIPEDIWEHARKIREECPVPKDGSPREGKHPGSLHAEAAIRHATQALREWSRRWNKPHDRIRTYTRLIERAIIAHEWVCGEDPAGDTWMTFKDACENAGVHEERMLEQITRGLNGAAMLWLASLAAICDESMRRACQPSSASSRPRPPATDAVPAAAPRQLAPLRLGKDSPIQSWRAQRPATIR